MAQSGVLPAERRRNIRHAFVVAPDALASVRGRHIGVVDDVMTSGATLQAAARALRAAGAAQIIALVVACLEYGLAAEVLTMLPEGVQPDIVRRHLRQQEGQTLDSTRLSRDLVRVFGEGDFEGVDYRLVSEGHLPASLVAMSPEWLRPMVGVYLCSSARRLIAASSAST